MVGVVGRALDPADFFYGPELGLWPVFGAPRALLVDHGTRHSTRSHRVHLFWNRTGSVIETFSGRRRLDPARRARARDMVDASPASDLNRPSRGSDRNVHWDLRASSPVPPRL
jgi:hypothetical protein